MNIQESRMKIPYFLTKDYEVKEKRLKNIGWIVLVIISLISVWTIIINNVTKVSK